VRGQTGFLLILNKILYIILILAVCSTVYTQTTAALGDSLVTEEILVTANRINNTNAFRNKVQVIGSNYFKI
jgi:hypothetical protein